NVIFNYLDAKISETFIKIFSTDIRSSNFNLEFELLHPRTNQLCWLLIRVYPIINNGNVVRYVCSISDLTKEKQSQKVLYDTLLNAQKTNEAKKEFLSHISHEIRTPINAVIGMAQIASNCIEHKERVDDCLKKITSSSKNLLTLLNNILDMAKMDSDKMLITKERFQLSEFLNSFAAIIGTQAEINQQNFSITISNIIDDCLLGDTLRLNQILSNCISNSLKFTPQGGKISVEVVELKKMSDKALFRFTISDNGKGMSEEYIERIFIPFEQEDGTIAKKYGGSGLGMSIAKNLVTLMGGTIHVASKLGVGTTITIDIIFDLPEDSINKSEDHEIAKSMIPELPNHRFLVVEDNKINLEITCELLKYLKISVETAANGEDAYKLFLSSAHGYYDAILMDVQMPGLNGYEATKVIRESEHPDAKSIYIIAMSADADPEDITLALSNGMNQHIAKPIDTEKFYTLLQNVFLKETILC
ncbi:MAG TPA: ATP-binding protein, partial [Mobilitalea sp.]|nr:ATP-binding protein [Mobilitalea sp.]